MAQFRTGEFSFCLCSELPQISKLQRASTVAIKFCLLGSHYYCEQEDYRVSRPEKKADSSLKLEYIKILTVIIFGV